MGGFSCFIGQILTGQSYIVPGTAEHNTSQIIERGVKDISASPAQLIALLDYLESNDDLKLTLDSFSIGGSSISEYLVEKAEKLLGAKIKYVYGSTEGGYIAYKTEGAYDPFEMGVLFPDVEVQIVDDRDSVSESGSIGRIRVKSKDAVDSYFLDVKASKAHFSGEWFYPGDMGYLTKESRLYLSGRSSELINFGGIKVDPAKIEHFIVGKHGVIDAASFGFLSKDGIENFGIAVVVSENFEVNKVQNELSIQYGAPASRNIWPVERIPRNENGKINRAALLSFFRLTTRGAILTFQMTLECRKVSN